MHIAARTAAVTLSCLAATAFAGPIAPPAGPVGPTMRTLSQVEPRIPVGPETTPGDSDSTPSLYKITQAGSYYLTGNITGESGKIGIEIVAPGVTLDLGGFVLQGVAGSPGSGVRVTTVVGQVAVRNGTVRGWTGSGIDADFVTGGHFEDLRLVGNTSQGLRAGGYAVVRACIAEGNAAAGIYTPGGSLVEACTARGNGSSGSSAGISVGAGSSVVNCAASSNTGAGIEALFDTTITGCTASANTGDGVFAQSRCTVTACTANANTGSGFRVHTGTRVTGCTANLNATGIRMHGPDNRIDGNNLGDNTTGLRAEVAGSFIVRNTVSGGTTRYSLTGTQTVGPIVTAGGTITSSNPWANFEF